MNPKKNQASRQIKNNHGSDNMNEMMNELNEVLAT